MTQKSSSNEQLRNLSEALLNDVLALSEQELLAELQAEGRDPVIEAADIQQNIADALALSGKACLASAKAAVVATRGVPLSLKILTLSVDEKQHILRQFAANDTQLQKRLTMAARRGKGDAESELDSILRDLRDLGAIDDQGNPL